MDTGVFTFMDGYVNFMETRSDPRTKDWALMSSPMPLLTILTTYLYFSASAGPRWMKDRKPFDLKYVLIAYNALQVVFSVWLVHEGLQSGWLSNYSYRCQPVDYSTNPLAIRMANACWWYLFCKLIELLDTVFFVLRKKNSQISPLHLWHHTLMPICAWIGVKFLPGGHGTLLGVINSFVHIIMYSYYLLAALGPEVQKHLWWKKYLTSLQIIQFAIVLLHSCQPFIYECNYPKFIVFLLMINSINFLYLFGTFYKRTYNTKKQA
ncbi:elongation of very long chain fatty acids protein AAEL008004-like [Zootermopsis nevadensis]|uniref:Elongation of very long chain fatty acids protein n=1 Tax=Zootermopsis nevadensis TaxID=136037 RepID=A0A067R2U3_ZOONE|nr:elongation of very long chain fatty acids protein AAEL008004-like [Zootermopsis nevadensis]XP_021933485.1 elongation of very long chain fatty acids protein AAEL008004-like [Zootermopsis nevadensis]KDR12083.1 Elongation of very long chain fatty acids protein [Zootermopsis nevadensis]